LIVGADALIGPLILARSGNGPTKREKQYSYRSFQLHTYSIIICWKWGLIVGADALIGPLISARSGNGPYREQQYSYRTVL